MSKLTAGVLKGILCLVLSTVLWTQGCASIPDSKQVSVQADNKAPEEYRIAPGDVLEIMVYGEEGLKNQELVVRPDGMVSFPLIGDVVAGDMTTAQVKEEVEQRVREYIPEAVASVGVRQLGSLQYYVVGKVTKPGMYNVSKPITVLQALSLAGGMTTFADEKSINIVRNQDGKVTNLHFNYKKIKKGQSLEQNIILERGDTIVVP